MATLCPDSTGWNAETKGSSFCRTARICEETRELDYLPIIAVVLVVCAIAHMLFRLRCVSGVNHTSVFDLETTFCTPSDPRRFRCFENGVSARKKG